MLAGKDYKTVLRDNRTLQIIIIVCIFLIELEIFIITVSKSGREAWIQIADQTGVMLYESRGDRLSEFDKNYFEKNFGDLSDYKVKLEVKNSPFPFRMWLASAIGIPIAVVLLFAFVMKAYFVLFYGENASGNGGSDTDFKLSEKSGRLDRLLHKVSSFNIFVIGFLVLLIVLFCLTIPDILAYIGNVGIDTVKRYKWVFITISSVFILIVVWIIYLRYLLAKKSIDARADVDKFRMQIEYGGKEELQIVHNVEFEGMETSDLESDNEIKKIQ